jgi:hypothetical protein
VRLGAHWLLPLQRERKKKLMSFRTFHFVLLAAAASSIVGAAAQAPGASPQMQPYYGYQPEYSGYQPQWQAPLNQQQAQPAAPAQQPEWQSAAPGQTSRQFYAPRRWPPAGTSAEWPPQQGSRSNEWMVPPPAPAVGQSHTSQAPQQVAPAPAQPPSQTEATNRGR